MNKLIYLDHSATTPVDQKVLKAMLPFFSDKFGNPSSIHSFGQVASAAINKSRETLAKFLNCALEEVIFTSGATESDNLAITGVVNALRKSTKEKLHIITSQIEHPAVLEPFVELEKQGVEVTYLPVQKNGVIRIDDFKKAIKNNTVFVSIMYVNSEVGSIEPIREIGKIIEKINKERLKSKLKNIPPRANDKQSLIYFHTDAVQAVNFLNCDTKYLHVDLLSLSGHKIYGPKGIGALYIKSGTPIEGRQLGGQHERNIRSGTLNVSGIVGLGAALNLLTKREISENNAKIKSLRDYLVKEILKNISGAVLNTDRENATPAHAHFSFPGAEGEAVLIALDLAGIAVSTGSACASGDLRPSHVLLAMGIIEEIAHSSLRITLGKNTTEAEINRLIKVLPPIIKRLKKMSPLN